MFGNLLKSKQPKPKGFSYSPTYYKPDEEKPKRVLRQEKEAGEEDVQARINRMREHIRRKPASTGVGAILNGASIRPLIIIALLVAFTYMAFVYVNQQQKAAQEAQPTPHWED